MRVLFSRNVLGMCKCKFDGEGTRVTIEDGACEREKEREREREREIDR